MIRWPAALAIALALSCGAPLEPEDTAEPAGLDSSGATCVLDPYCACDGERYDPGKCGCSLDEIGACACDGAPEPAYVCATPCVMADKGCHCGTYHAPPSFCE